MFGENKEAAQVAMYMRLEQLLNELSAGLSESHNARPVDAARYLPAGGRKLAWGAPGRLVGWSVHAVDGPVTVYLRDGRDESSEEFAIVDLVEGETNAQWFGPGGVAFTEALYAHQAAGGGRLVGSWWIGAVD
jgi:hypothetical protein